MHLTTTIICVCGVFLDFQKTFDTVNHDILLSNLHLFGTRAAESTVNGFNKYSRSTARFSFGSAATYIYIYISDLNKVIQHSVMHHFADDTNLLYSSNSLKQIRRYVNHDLIPIVHWL